LGDVVLAGVEQGQGFGGPIIEEANACLLGFRCAKEAGLLNLVVDGDCLTIINLLKSSKVQDTFVGFLAKDIITLVASFNFLFLVVC